MSLADAPHVVYYINPQGRPQSDTIRLSGNVLLWQHGPVTLRLEGRLSEQREILIAQSMAPVKTP